MKETVYKHILQLAMSFSLGNTRMFDLLNEGLAKLDWEYDDYGCKMSLDAGNKKVDVYESILIDSPLMPEKQKIICTARAFWRCASEICGFNPEWGIIDGVKPVRLYLNLKESGLCGEKILKENYLVSDKKAQLVSRIGDYEYSVGQKLPKNSYNLYVSIPFCPTRCKYCSFISANSSLSGLLPQYLDTLCKEIKDTADVMKNIELNTIYIGGGTPTVLDEVQLERLLATLKSCFDIKGIEFTLEAGRPDTINEKKLETALQYGVNRISINTQTTNDSVLENIGRCHSAENYYKAFRLARSMGVPCINTDLIAGFENDTFEKSLEDVISLSPENLTIHTLCVKNSAYMREDGFVRKQEQLSKLLEFSESMCHNNDYVPYYLYKQKNAVSGLENIGYSKKGFECVYNICMMSELNSTIALGAGASTKIVSSGKSTDRTESFFDCKYPKEYIENNEKRNRKIQFLKEKMT